MNLLTQPEPSHKGERDEIARFTDEPAFGFGDLRERGLTLSQKFSGELWTDYNHHDPGVTLLEALCFALTEGVFGADVPIGDILAAPNGLIPYRRYGLHRAEEILPCRPTTELDLLRWMLDHVPQIRHLRLQMQQYDSAMPNGVWQMALRTAESDAASVSKSAAQAYWTQRNLCEDLDGLPRMLRPRWCRLCVSISVQGPRDLTDLLAEMVQRSADYISATPPRQSLQARLDQMLAEGEPCTPSEIYEGPLLRGGWIATNDLARDPANRLFFSDLAQVLRGMDGIAEIHHLSLVIDDMPAEEGGLPWHGEDWALQLRWPETAAAVADWSVLRRGSKLTIDAPALMHRLADERQVSRGLQGAALLSGDVFHALAKQSGRYLAHHAYFAAYHHLPPLYHEPEAMMPTGKHRRSAPAQAQFIAYQSLLEQWLAHGEAQLHHLRDLYSLQQAPKQSYWWQPLNSAHLPGLDALQSDHAAGQSPGAAAHAGVDDVLERRGRVLDQLLALHGEGCGQSSILSFGWYYSPTGWLDHLYECKRQLLLRIVRHTRDRYGAIDYSRKSLDRKGNTAALQERIGLLLAFEQTHSRLLMKAVSTFGVNLAETSAVKSVPSVTQAPAARQSVAMWGPLRERVDARLAIDMAEHRVGPRLQHYLPSLDMQALPPALLRCAAHADRYWLDETDALRPLWLGPDEDGRWWPLAMRPVPGTPSVPALYLHEFACRLQRASEGVHLVEHILLRPTASTNEGVAALGSQPDDVPADFYPHQISVVLPAWTARGADGTFRHLAWESTSLSCPAHILPHLLWLNIPDLREFERLYQAWLTARQAHCEALLANAANTDLSAKTLDSSAASLRRWLWARLLAKSGGGQ